MSGVSLNRGLERPYDEAVKLKPKMLVMPKSWDICQGELTGCGTSPREGSVFGSITFNRLSPRTLTLEIQRILLETRPHLYKIHHTGEQPWRDSLRTQIRNLECELSVMTLNVITYKFTTLCLLCCSQHNLRTGGPGPYNNVPGPEPESKPINNFFQRVCFSCSIQVPS